MCHLQEIAFLLQGSKFAVATVANATMFCHLLPGCSSGSKHLLLPKMHGIVNLMHAFVCSVCNAITYTTQDDRGSKFLWQKKWKSSVFTNNSANISLRLFYNSLLQLPRMCYVLVSNGWLDSRSNSNICKSACASEWHVFGIWGIGQFHHPYSR